MNAELLYTSAPSGLKQGSRGFCTVLSTAGMPINLASKLESLSGYRHIYPSGTPDAIKNPVGYSHFRFSLGGRTVSVLSRISDYGLDYSQRTNKLAHHIVVESPFPACGPAALLLEPGVMRAEWDGQCATVPSPTLPMLESSPRPCSSWSSITGDAGWGGVVANAWYRPQPKPLFIIYSEEQSSSLLTLIAEAIALLPTKQRWQATFGTYVTNLPPDVDCKVRYVIAGGEEARMASARGSVIDLTKTLGPAADSDATRAARSGSYIGVREPATRDIIPVPQKESTHVTPSVPGNSFEDDEYEFDVVAPFAKVSKQRPPDVHYSSTSHATTPGTPPPHKEARIPFRGGLIAALICIILMSCGLIVFVAYRNSQQLALAIKETLNPTETDASERTKAAISNEPVVGPPESRDVTGEPIKDTQAIETKSETVSQNTAIPASQESDQNSASNPMISGPRPITESDFQLVASGFSMRSDKLKTDESIPLAFGIVGAEADFDITTTLEDIDAHWKEKWVTWEWQERVGDMPWKPISGETTNKLKVTKIYSPNTEVRAVVIVTNPDGQQLAPITSQAFRIVGEVEITVSINEASKSADKTDIYDTRCDFVVPEILDNEAPTDLFVSIGNRKEFSDLNLRDIKRLLQKPMQEFDDTIKQLKDYCKLESEVSTTRQELLRLCNNQGGQLERSKGLARILQSDKSSELLETELSQFAQDTDRIVEQCKKFLEDKSKSMDLPELEAAAKLWGLPSQVSPDVTRMNTVHFPSFWNKEFPALKDIGGSPRLILSRLVESVGKLKRTRDDLTKTRLSLRSADDAFQLSKTPLVNRSNSENPGLASGTIAIGKFGLAIRIAFVDDRPPGTIGVPTDISGQSPQSGRQRPVQQATPTK